MLFLPCLPLRKVRRLHIRLYILYNALQWLSAAVLDLWVPMPEPQVMALVH